MNDDLLEMIEREVLSWPGVSKETGVGGSGRGRSGFYQRPSTGSVAGRSGTSTTQAWRTLYFRGRSTMS